MSEKRNLWIGLLLGLLLTGLLMFVLHLQADLPEVRPPVDNVTDAQIFKPRTSADMPVEQMESSSSATLSVPAMLNHSPQQQETVNPEVTHESVSTQQATQPEQQPEVVKPVLPEALSLSPEELQELSAAELDEYQALLASYREVRTQVLRLHQEREQLKQRIDTMFQQNEVMESELDKMREVVRAQSQQ